MPYQPSPGDLYVNPLLTDVSLSYLQDEAGFIADDMFPDLPVDLQSGLIGEWDLDYVLRNEVAVRPPGAESKGIGLKVSNIAYACEVEAIHHDIPDQNRANDRLGQDKQATRVLTQQCMQKREIRLKSKVFQPSIWTGFADKAGVASGPGANQFVQFDQATSTPVKTVLAWSSEIKFNTGLRPNKMAMGRQVWDILKTNPDILDRLKFNGKQDGRPIQVSLDAVAALFEMEEILVSDVIQRTSNEGAATAVNQWVIGKELWLGLVANSPSLDTPTAGYTVTWKGYHGMNDAGCRIKRFRMEQNAADRIEVEQAYDHAMIGKKLGGYASAVIA